MSANKFAFHLAIGHQELPGNAAHGFDPVRNPLAREVVDGRHDALDEALFHQLLVKRFTEQVGELHLQVLVAFFQRRQRSQIRRPRGRRFPGFLERMRGSCRRFLAGRIRSPGFDGRLRSGLRPIALPPVEPQRASQDDRQHYGNEPLKCVFAHPRYSLAAGSDWRMTGFELHWTTIILTGLAFG
jgi:hypothetical protein